jgi:hypothetical protein
VAANGCVRWSLTSDMHIGHIACDENRIADEVEQAADLGAWFHVNGDVFDCVPRADKKRFDSTQVVPEVRRSRNPRDVLVKRAFKLFAPAASRIVLIGNGNHEECWTRVNESDLVTDLIAMLNAHLADKGSTHRIVHGKIRRWIVSKLDVPSGQGKPLTLTHKMLAHHGAGGDASVTKGAVEHARIESGNDYDCYTHGHKHWKTQGITKVQTVRPNGRVVERKRLVVQTGSYFDNFAEGDPDDPMGYTYAESKNHMPKPWGGWVLQLQPERSVDGWEVGQYAFEPGARLNTSAASECVAA